jgi:hypothetical protein
VSSSFWQSLTEAWKRPVKLEQSQSPPVYTQNLAELITAFPFGQEAKGSFKPEAQTDGHRS